LLQVRLASIVGNAGPPGSPRLISWRTVISSWQPAGSEYPRPEGLVARDVSSQTQTRAAPDVPSARSMERRDR